MLPLILAGVGAGLGLLKQFHDQSNADSQNRIAAVKELYSPWTGQHGKMADQPDMIQNIGSGALAGGSFGQGVGESNAHIDQMDKENKWLDRGYSPWMGGGFSGGYGPGPSNLNGPVAMKAMGSDWPGGPLNRGQY